MEGTEQIPPGSSSVSDLPDPNPAIHLIWRKSERLLGTLCEFSTDDVTFRRPCTWQMSH